MKQKMKSVVAMIVLSVCLLFSYPSMAQGGDNSQSTQSNTTGNSTDSAGKWGLIGLVGLLGFLGLRKHNTGDGMNTTASTRPRV